MEMGWDAAVAETYTATLKGIDTAPNQVFDLRVPGVGEFMSSLAAGVARAQSGEQSPQEALDGVAAEWTAIVDRIGADRVREAYANVVALEDR
jgi:multiple sugar transport system substrate-binding protein